MDLTPDQETKPFLVRGGKLLTAIGASEPSLTVLEFQSTLVLLLAEGFQLDSYSEELVLESVQLAQCGGREWRTTDYQRVCLDGFVCSAALKPNLPTRAIGNLSSQFAPVVIFITKLDLTRLTVAFEQGDFERLFKFARSSASEIAELGFKFEGLNSRYLARKQRPIKETVRISLPPKPKETVRVSLPPKP